MKLYTLTALCLDFEATASRWCRPVLRLSRRALLSLSRRIRELESLVEMGGYQKEAQ